MISKIEMVEKKIGPVIEIEENSTILKMSDRLGTDYSLLYTYLEDNNVDTKEAMPYTHHIDLDWEEAVHKKSGLKTMIDLFTRKQHYFAGVSTGKKLQDKKRIVTDDYMTTKCVHCTHTGPYKEMGEAYEAMVEWAHSHDVVLRNEAFEFYLNEPNSVSESELKTEVVIPVG